MFKEITVKEALERLQNGERVLVFDTNTEDMEGRIQLLPMELIFKGYHYIIDDERPEEAAPAEPKPEEPAPVEPEPAESEEEKQPKKSGGGNGREPESPGG